MYASGTGTRNMIGKCVFDVSKINIVGSVLARSFQRWMLLRSYDCYK